VYATIGSYGIYRPLSITKVDPPVPGERVFPESIVRTVVHMMESVALPGGGGVKAAIKGYRIAIKTGTAKKVGPRAAEKSHTPGGVEHQSAMNTTPCSRH
ncbi:Peptidoglycan synthase FtsI, partial [human gut metagenome]